MIAQLFVANAAGLTFASDGASRTALSLFLVGLVLAMACSLAAWWQSHITYDHLATLADPNALLGVNYMPKIDAEEDKREHRWFAAAVIAGVSSLAAFTAGALLRIWG